MVRVILSTLAILIVVSLLAVAATIRSEDKYPAGEASAGLCSQATAQPNSVRARQAEDLLRQTLQSDHGSGLAAAVVVDGDLVWSGAAGHADRRNGVDLSPASRLRIGSVSKPITAALAARLADAGLIDLDAPIQTYVPAFPSSSAPITIRMLGHHLSGVRHYDFANFEESNSRKQFDDLESALALLGDAPFVAEPMEALNYSSFGYNLIGAAIENATQLSFADALDQYLSEPAALGSITVDDPSRRIPCRARFYTVYFGWLVQNTIWRNHSDAYPSAGVLISVEDLAAFAYKAHASDSFSAQSRDLFTMPGRTIDGDETSYSFGWHIDRNDKGEIVSYSHGGLTNGAYAEVRYYPDTKTAVAVISNYNLFLTEKRPAFDAFAAKALPELFGALN